jgi:class 3 adenylate cyclase
MVFADVRNSTRLAEGMSSVEFSRLMSRFFAVSSEILTRHHAWVDRFVGAGEILISKSAYLETTFPEDSLETRTVELKGKSIPLQVYVLKIGKEKG